MSGKKLLFIGYGDIAGRSSRQLATNGYHITGVSRSPKTLPHGAIQWLGAVQSEEILQKIRTTAFDAVVITLTPSERGDEGYKAAYVDTMQALCHLWQTHDQPPKLVIFVSSSSVYGQCGGEWVDETSVTTPSNFSGQRILEAEQRLLELARQRPSIAPCIVRFSGIYGPGRDHLLRQVLAGKAGTDSYTNRIHIEDCSGVLAHLIEQHSRGASVLSHYLASDNKPVTAKQVREWMAQKMGFSPAHLQEDPNAKNRAGSKRCSNKRLIDSGYRLHYPSYQEGYTPIIKSFKAQVQSQQQ